MLNVSQETKTGKNNKPYQVLKTAYKNLTFQGKVEGKDIFAFGATAETFKTLATAQTGDVFDIEIVKNNAGYNDWVSAKKSTGATIPTDSASRPSSGGSSSTPVRSTYETPEERAKKQVYIVRQSSVSSAIGLLSVGAKSPPSVDAVIDTASKIEAFVFGEAQPNESLSKGMRIEDLQDSDID